MKISKNKQNCFFSCPKEHSTQKLSSQVKRCGLQPADGRTDRHTHASDYCGHPFRISGVFPSTYHQGSAQQKENQTSVLDKAQAVSVGCMTTVVATVRSVPAYFSLVIKKCSLSAYTVNQNWMAFVALKEPPIARNYKCSMPGIYSIGPILDDRLKGKFLKP